MIKFLPGFFILLLIFACRQRTSNLERDVSINPGTSFNNLFFDSSLVNHFLDSITMTDLDERKEFHNFYRQRNYQFAWIDSTGPAEQAFNFINLLQDSLSGMVDSFLSSSNSPNRFKHISVAQVQQEGTDSVLLHTELALTAAFFEYAKRVYKGSDVDAKALGWFIPRKKINVIQALDSLISNKAKSIEKYEPLNRQFRLLHDFLQQYASFQKVEWPELVIPGDRKSLKPGDSMGVIRAIKQRLALTGDLTVPDTSLRFNPKMVTAVKSFQRRFGLTVDGIAGAGVVRELNVAPAKRIEQLLVNLERVRWMPAEPITDYLLINIPEFMLYAFEKGRLRFRMNVVVGTAANNTVIFNGDLKFIVFSPYWNVPPDIMRDEVLPAMKKSATYLSRNNMEIAGYNGKVPKVRQKPGGNNSLGRVKFLFPNSYNIYLHDTPFKDRFNAAVRTFSHGCIRLSDPEKLASFLLRGQKSWPDSAIRKAMHLEKEKWVTLTPTVPVYITYFTAWVDAEGKLNFRKDIYGHDEKMAEKLFAK